MVKINNKDIRSGIVIVNFEHNIFHLILVFLLSAGFAWK